MKSGLTEIVCILDRSGSMSSIIGDAIGGLNTFIEGQKALSGEANITIVLFDNDYELLHDNVPISQISEITQRQYYPRGMTALYDAVGRTIDNIGVRLSNTPESDRPEKVIVAILTDGLENSSTEYTALSVKEKIEEQESVYSWAFVYLAANQNAFEVGSQFGMKQDNTLNFTQTSKGAKSAFSNVSLYSSTVRGMSMDTYSPDVLYSMAKSAAVEQ